MFRGRFEHSLDDKGRLAIPARFRDLIGKDEGPGTLVVTNSEGCLAAYPIKEWEELEKKIAKLPQFDPKVAAFKRYVIGCAQECNVDKAGRILIPSDLRKDAKIDRDCIILGQLTKVEIWSAERFEGMFHEVSDQFTNISMSLADMGIEL